MSFPKLGPLGGNLERTERFYRIQQLLEARRSISSQDLQDELEISRATLNRDIQYLRDRLGMPIVWDADLKGYRLERRSKSDQRFHLPGMWLTEAELSGIVSLTELVGRFDPSGVLGKHVRPLRDRLGDILAGIGVTSGEFEKRVRVLSLGTREVEHACFPELAHATLTRRRVVIDYYTRSTNEQRRREISPQKLVFYRQNWYLDAWCHFREGLRSFALDCVLETEQTETPAQEVAEDALSDFFSKGYGIFSGDHAVQWAVLRFSPVRARWVARERWHSQQQGEFTALGEFILKVPYTMDEELIGDILRHGVEVEVMSPPELRAKVREAHLAAGHRYLPTSD